LTATVTLATTSGGSQMTGPTLLLASISPNEPTITATLNPAANTFASKPWSTNATLTVTTTVGTPANTYTIQVVGSTNPPNSLVVTPITNTFTLVVSNTSANVVVSQSHALDNSVARAQLDLSGLDTFNARVARLLVGADVSIKGAAGLLKLAKTNLITLASGSTAPQLDIGDNTLAQGIAGTNSSLLLGQTNIFFVDSIAVGRGKNTGSGGNPYTAAMLFNGAFSAPAAYFRGSGGASSRVGTWSIGDAFNAKSLPALGLNDFSAGTVDALVDTMYVGKSASVASGSSGTGTLVLNGGTMDVNTLKIGFSDINSGSGTVTVNGGVLAVNTSLELAHNSTITANGTLNIYGGTVTANAGITMGGGISKINVSSGTLNVTNIAATVGAAGAPVSFMTLTNSTLNLAVKGSAPAVLVDTYFSTGGTTNTINFTALPLLTSLPAQFPVIAFIPADIFMDGAFNLGLGTLPPGGYAGYISNNAANFSVDLVLTAGPVTPILTWDGAASGDWDTSTANWKTNGVLTAYRQGYPLVRFDDSLAGTSTVRLTTTLTPGSVTVNNTRTNYMFAGAGSLSGAASLTKSGAGTLTLDNSGSNDFTGGVTIVGGVLQIGNADTNGNLPLGNIADNGSLNFNRADNLTVANAITGLGAVAQLGPGTLTISGANTFADVTTVAGGTLKVGSATALGTTAGGTTVTNTGTLDVNGFSLGLEPVTVSGAGLGGAGALVNNGTSQSKVLRAFTLAGSAFMQVSKTTGTSDLINGATTITYGRTLSLANLRVHPRSSCLDLRRLRSLWTK
jgi:fibronectin-binding autotransporter adhesin